MDDTTLAERINDHIEKVQTLTNFYSEPLNRAFTMAHSDFLKLHAPMMRLYSARDYANNMHVHLRDNIKKVFSGFHEVDFDEKPGRSFKMLIDGRARGIQAFVAFILKKQGRNYQTSNIKTATVERYNKQIIDYLNFEPLIQNTLFDVKGNGKKEQIMNWPKCANLVAGYQIDATWSAFSQLAVTMPFSFRKILLINDFTNITANEVADIVELPQRETEKTPRVRRRVVPAAAPMKADKVNRFFLVKTDEVSEDADIRKTNE